MHKLTILVIRMILGAFFAVILTRFFFPGADMVTIAGVAFLLVGLAYVFDYLRFRRTDG